MNIVDFPKHNIADIPQTLRNLADSIEQGEYGEAHALVWVIDCGSADIAVGLIGQTAEPGAAAYYMLGLAQRELEG